MIKTIVFAFWTFAFCLADFVTDSAYIWPDELYPNELSYFESLEAVANNSVYILDGSSGTAWFNTTRFCIPGLHFREIGYHAVVSQESYNYLLLLTQLAEAALSSGYYGDYVFLLFKFSHEGRELPTQIRSNSPIVDDMSRSLDTITNFPRSSQALIKELGRSTEVPIIKNLYEIIRTERKSRFLRFYRNTVRKIGRIVLDYKDDSLYYLFVRLIGVPVLSFCNVKSIYDDDFRSFDAVLAKEISKCRDSEVLDFFGQSCSIKLILPKKSNLRSEVC